MNSNQETHEFILSVEEMDFLRRITSKEESLNSVLKGPAAVRGDKFSLRLGRIEAEAVRDFLTEQLARSGFEEDYSLTKQGHMLEELIDRFYIA